MIILRRKDCFILIWTSSAVLTDPYNCHFSNYRSFRTKTEQNKNVVFSCCHVVLRNDACGDTPSSSTDTDRVHRRSTDADRVHRRSTGSTDGQRGPQTVNGRRQGPQTASMIHGQPDYRSATTCSQQTATRPTGRWLQGPEPISTKIPWSCVHYRHIATTL